ncbi:MAG: 2-hydroxychromene-2-carboxylate isomerase [Deltaproteobacteria bacterium]|nr:2-hydroxychromene-2-carboxylate isomerase [Deltaproteobacteria bacterium]
MPTLHFFYDVVCPFAYLASTQVERVAAAHRAELRWRPFLLGGVFRHLYADGRAPTEHMSPAKARHNLLDMHRWAELWKVPFAMPVGHPFRTVTAMRAVVAAPDVVRASHALFRAYWVSGLDVSKADVVATALDDVGLDGAAIVARTNDADIKDRLRLVTDEAIEAGVFGAPAFLVEREGWTSEIFWGQDRLALVEDALLRGRDAA